MFRSRGIDYKFPRSSGGRFYFAKIDSGRVTTWEPPYTESPVSWDNMELWAWNKQNLNEFNSGSAIYIGNTTGTITQSYLSGGMGDRRYIPSIRYTFSSNFQTPRSGGMALIPIDPGFPLPRRYELTFTIRKVDFGGGELYAGLYFNANQLTASTANFHASAIMIGDDSQFVKTFNITTGALGRRAPTKGSQIFIGNDGPCVVTFLVETRESTGSASGPNWRLNTMPSSLRYNPILLQTGIANETSGSNSTWINAGNLDRFGIWFGRTSSGSVSLSSGDYVEIQEILIRKHPQEV